LAMAQTARSHARAQVGFSLPACVLGRSLKMRLEASENYTIKRNETGSLQRLMAKTVILYSLHWLGL